MSYTATGEPRRHRLTVADYYRMGEVGILAPDARVELIDGEIIDMAPIGSLHAGTVDQLALILRPNVAEHAHLRVQNPLQLDDHSEPQPDISLLKPRADFYKSRRPRRPSRHAPRLEHAVRLIVRGVVAPGGQASASRAPN